MNSLRNRLEEYEGALRAAERMDDLEYLRKLGEVTQRFPSMCHATGSRECADGYVVALAALDGYTVVADESLKRRNRKIPGACEQLGVKWLGLEESGYLLDSGSYNLWGS
jgi:hypothetical protein